MVELKDFTNFSHWSRLLAPTGAVIAIGSFSIGHPLGYFFMGVGLLFFGIGETENRPDERQKETKKGMLGFRMVPVHPWKPTPFGLAMDALGIGLFCFGFYSVAFAP